MSQPSLPSQVDQVRSILSTLQDSLTSLPAENQNQVLLDLIRIASTLRAHPPANRNSRQPEGNTPVIETDNQGTSPGFVDSEAWLGNALKQAHVAAWQWDLTRNTVKWSSGTYELLQLDPANEVSDPQTFFDMIHPDDRDRFVDELTAVLERGGPFTLEYRITGGDGKTIWLSTTGSIEHDPSGRAIRAAGIDQDITARKQAEFALRESEERERAKAAELTALMDAVPAMIWISRDPECKVMVGNQYGNEALSMWEGSNISKTAPYFDLAQQPYRNFKDGKEIPDGELPMQIAASTGVGTSNYEFDLVFANGVTKNLLGNVVPLTDPEGKPGGAVAVFVDITERKQMEEYLTQSEARLREWKDYIAFWNKATNSFFWILMPDGSYQNPILTEPGVSGRSLDDTRGWNWIKVLHPDDQEPVRSLWEQAIRQQSGQEFEARVWHEASQQYRWFSHRVVPLLEEGTLKGWIGASLDIQEHKELEQALKEKEIHMATQRRLLEAREIERGKIARDIHDGPIQTLVSTLFHLHSLKEDVADPCVQDGLNPIRDSLKDAVDELRQVVNELRPLTLTRFGLVRAIRGHAEDFREKYPELAVSLNLSVERTNYPEQVSLALYRICQEALNNVIRHAQATTAAIRLTSDENQVILEIEDNGTGFAISKNFSKLTADKHFGLAGMNERAEAVGGSLRIVSKPGVGTTIRVVIPILVE